MTGTSKATIISRTENMGEPAITSWGEQACIRASASTATRTFAFSIIMHRLVSDRLVISTLFRTKFWRSLKAQLPCGLLIGAVSCMQEISFPFQLLFPTLGDPSMIWPFISPLSLHPAVPADSKSSFQPFSNGTSPLQMFLSLLPLLKSVECRSPALPSPTQRLRG